MKTYIGTKLINARPMTRAEYNAYRGWTLPADENGADEGFLVEYLDGGRANDMRHVGYISWSPAGVFARAYRETSGMSFGLAIEAMKQGHRVSRAGWNGKGMWLCLVNGYTYNPSSIDSAVYALGCKKLPWIGMKTADNGFVPWLASQTDMLAEDWTVVEK
jgi:hypothetical protein